MVLLTTLTYLCTMMLLLPFLYLGAFIMADIGKKIKSRLTHDQTKVVSSIFRKMVCRL